MPIVVNRCAICNELYWNCECALWSIRELERRQQPYLAQRFGVDNTTFQVDLDNFKHKIEQIKEKNKVSIPKRLTKKYYVGSSSVFNPGMCPILKATVDEAIAEAKDKLEQTGEEQFVVQIIRIVRPVKPEVFVQKV